MWEKIVSYLDVGIVVLFGGIMWRLFDASNNHGRRIDEAEKRLDKGEEKFEEIRERLTDIRIEVGKINEHILVNKK